MKIKLITSKITLLALLSLSFNLSHKTSTAQSVSIKKEDQKGTDSASFNYIIKYKIKAVTTLMYDSEDSTLNNAKLASKEKAIYDRNGNLLENLNENNAGKIINRTVSKFDLRNNLIEATVYDSTNKVISSEKKYYDDLNRIMESSSSLPLSLYTMKREDDNKISTYTYRNKYDLNSNLIESATDSNGVIIYKTVSKFDNKNQLVFSENYEHNVLQSTQTNVYDKKGGYTQTVEYYWTASKTQCAPNKNRTVTKFDSKGNAISSISISDENGSISKTKTTSEFNYYNADKLLSLKTITETNSEGFSSKSTTTQTYKYDKNGNEIESVAKYGGSGSSTYTTQTEYNGKNSVTKQTVYNGTCKDKPSNVVVYVYYPDGISLKEVTYEWFDYPSKSTDKYDERSIPTERITISSMGSGRTVYNYEYWQ